MRFLKNFIKPFSGKNKNGQEEEKQLPLDQLFVENFIEKGGKFIYCTTIPEVVTNLESIMKESEYNNVLCYDHDLVNIIQKNNIKNRQIFSPDIPFFTTCEYLIANSGDIMFNSNQLLSRKIVDFSSEFILYATTSQLVKNIGEGMAGINRNYKGNLPTNISNIRYYKSKTDEESFMNYGNSNSKNLYLLLFEDL